MAHKVYLEEVERLVGEYNQQGQYGDIYAMDGKALRGMHKKEGTGLEYLLSVYDVDQGKTLSQVEVGCKENEKNALNSVVFPMRSSILSSLCYVPSMMRDIATCYRLEAVTALKELAFYLMSNPASLVSFNKLNERFRLGSVNTIKSYIDYLENSWLVFTLNLYAYSVKHQQIAPKKIYAIDTGLSNAVGFGFSPNTGKLMENLVFLALRQQTKEFYYYTTPGGYKVDFCLPEKRQLVIRPGSQVTAQPHCNRPGSDLGQPGSDNDIRGCARSRNPRSQRKGNRQAIRHADDNVAHRFGGGKVTFDMGCSWHGSLLVCLRLDLL